MAEAEGWHDEARTAIALELAAARLLAHGAAPVMPRFAGRLAAALGMPAPACWPTAAELLAPGSRVELADQVFFGAAPAPADRPRLLDWLTELVTVSLRLTEAPADATLIDLGASSLQTVALQYQILEGLGVDVLVDELLGELDLSAVAALLEERAGEAAVAAAQAAAEAVDPIGVAA